MKIYVVMHSTDPRGETTPRITRGLNYIMPDNKYKLGKYYTPKDVVDLILALCLKKPSDKILDPACGPGIFLAEALSRLSFLNETNPGLNLLEQIWGVDLDPKSVELARQSLNMIMNGKDNVHLLNMDFFDIDSSRVMKTTLESWCGKETLPSVNAVVGNPPYTRQEELTPVLFGSAYKDKLCNIILKDYPELTVSKMASIYIYFLIHAASFLPSDGGRLGFVTLRSWMDTKYGSALRNFLTRYFKIHLIIESEVEKWFTEAQMLPCIIVAETCENELERNSNMVKIVRLKQNLSSYWSAQSQSDNERWKRIDDFASSLEGAENIIEFRDIGILNRKVLIHESQPYRVLAIEQKSLSEDGKWGKYLVAPATFFRILKCAAGLLTQLSDAGTVLRGVTTGANDFFLFPNRFFSIKEEPGYLVLTEKGGKKQFRIESEYVYPVLRSRRKHSSIALRTSDGFILTVNASKESLKITGKRVLDYIEYGESTRVRLRRGLKDAGRYIVGFNNLPTVNSRQTWFFLPNRKPAPIILPNIFWRGYVAFYNEIGLKPINSFYEIYPKESINPKVLCALLNSTLFAFFAEFSGRYIENRDGTRSNQLMIYDVDKIPIIDPKKIHSFDSSLEKILGSILRIKDGSKPVSRINEELKELDRIVFCEILELSEEEMETIRKDLGKIISQRLRTTDHRFLNSDVP